MDRFTDIRIKKQRRLFRLRLFLFVICSCLCVTTWLLVDYVSKVSSSGLLIPKNAASPFTSGDSTSVSTLVPAMITTEQGEQIPSAPTSRGSAYRLFENSLTGSELDFYVSCRDAVANFVSSVPFKTTDCERTMFIARQVHTDYPEFFWFTGDVSVQYTKRGNYYSGNLNFTFSCDQAALAARKRNLNDAAASVISDLGRATDYEKVKGVYEYLINHSRYNDYVRDQTCYSLLVNGQGVCAGYASAMKYLLDRLDVDCIIASGVSKGESHSWNLVRLDGMWYQVDPTWGDPKMDDGGQVLSYDYLLLDDNEMLLDHQYDEGIAYPHCYNDKYNFYKYEGLYLTSCDYSTLSRMLRSCIENGRDFVFKCDSLSLFYEVERYLLDQNQIFSLLKDYGYRTNRISCSMDESHRTFCVELV